MRHGEAQRSDFRLSRVFRGLIPLLLTAGLGLAPRPAQAQAVREFVMSSAYGVLAGTLVGAATLAFVDKPGENLNNIARGASIGLYAGMLLGLYVVYGVPSADDPLSEEEPVAVFDSGLRPAGASVHWKAPIRSEGPSLALVPQFHPQGQGLSGATLRLSLLEF